MQNLVNDTMALADAIVKYQKQKRAQPFVTELQRVGGQWAGANPQQRQNLNTEANAIRNAYLQAGGSPIDIDRSLWGSNSSAGFQTGQKQFTPGYFGDNLSRGQKMRDAELTGMYERKPTWQREYQTAGLTGLFQGRPTLDKINADRNYELGRDTASRGWAGIGLEQQGLGLREREFGLSRDKFEFEKNQKPAYDEVMSAALELAMKDPMFTVKTPAEQQIILDNFYGMLKGQSAPKYTLDQLQKYVDQGK